VKSISPSALFTLVKKGKLEKFIFEGYKECFFRKSVIDEMALERENFYTTSQAMEKLDVPRSTLLYLGKRGVIQSITLEGYKENCYSKSVIDEMALKNKMLLLQYAPDPSCDYE